MGRRKTLSALKSGMDSHTILQMTGLSEAELADIRQTD